MWYCKTEGGKSKFMDAAFLPAMVSWSNIINHGQNMLDHVWWSVEMLDNSTLPQGPV